jgi:hypothetical protein
MTDQHITPAKILRTAQQEPPMSAGARTLLRGVQRMMRTLGYESLSEVPLANARRADVLAISTTAEVRIIEIKSGIADFRSDTKWPEYRAFCDRFYFAVDAAFPIDILPEDAGIIIADAYGAELIREAPCVAMPAARRKAVTLSVARLAATRLHALIDPSAPWG